MQLSKNALGNLINRYKAVLKKCHILNNFGSMLKHSACCALLGGAFVAHALMPGSAQAATHEYLTFLTEDRIITIPNDTEDYLWFEPVTGINTYVSRFSLPHGNLYGFLYKKPGSTPTTTYYSDVDKLLQSIIPQTVSGRYTIALGTTVPAGSFGFSTTIGTTTTNYFVTSELSSELRIDGLNTFFSASISGDAFYELTTLGGAGIYGGAIFNESDGSTYDISADFFANSATGSGGAIHNGIISSGTVSPASIGDITDSTFIANTAVEDGGAINNYAFSALVDPVAKINDISKVSFIANEAVVGGGAINNYASGDISNNTVTAEIGDITDAIFIANSAGSIGGAIRNYAAGNAINNTVTAEIGDITNTTFIANTAGGSGGAIHNFADGDSANAQIGDITNVTFIANTATQDGGAIYNNAEGNTATASIGTINADFLANTAGGEGGAIYTNTDLDFLADSVEGKVNIFSGNKDKTGYNAIHVGALSNVTLNFKMANKGSFMLNDNIKRATIGIYDVNIEGGSANSFTLTNDTFIVDDSNNVFYLNNEIKDARNVNVKNATLTLGTVRHTEPDVFLGGISALDFSPKITIEEGGMLEVAVGKGETAKVSGVVAFEEGSIFRPSLGQLSVQIARFEENTLMIYYADSMGDDRALTSADYLTPNRILHVAEGAKLYVTSSAITGTKIILADGFTNSASSVRGFSGDDLYYWTPSSLQQIVANPFDTINGQFSVKLVHNTAEGVAFDYPQLQRKTVLHLSLVSADVNSNNNAKRFFSRVADERFVGRIKSKEATKVIEGIFNFGNIAGINRTGIDVANVVREALKSRTDISDSGAASGSANSQTPAVVMLEGNNQNLPLEHNGVSAGSHTPDSDLQNGFALWLSPLYKHSAVHSLEVGSFDHSRSTNIGGLTLGADYTYDEKFRLGLAFNLGTGITENTDDFYKTQNDFDFWNLSLYGAYYKNNFALLADVGISKIFGDVTQEIPSSMLMSSLEASTESTVWSAGLRAEYTFNTDFMDITPYAGVRYTYVQTEEYDVKSGGTVMSIEAESQGVWSFPVGLSFSKDIESDSGWTFTTKLDLGFIGAAGDFDAISNVSIPGVAGSTTYNMQNIDGIAFNGGLGFEVANDDNGVSIGLNYNLQASKHETSHMVNAVFRFEF